MLSLPNDLLRLLSFNLTSRSLFCSLQINRRFSQLVQDISFHQRLIDSNLAIVTTIGEYPYTECVSPILPNGKKHGIELIYECRLLSKRVPWVMGQRHGFVVTYTINGRLYRECPYVDGKREGLVRLWFCHRADGNLQGPLYSECYYQNGQIHGLFRKYSYSGNIMEDLHYQNGQIHGINKEWRPDSTLLRETIWEHNHIVLRKEYDSSGQLVNR